MSATSADEGGANDPMQQEPLGEETGSRFTSIDPTIGIDLTIGPDIAPIVDPTWDLDLYTDLYVAKRDELEEWLRTINPDLLLKFVLSSQSSGDTVSSFKNSFTNSDGNWKKWVSGFANAGS